MSTNNRTTMEGTAQLLEAMWRWANAWPEKSVDITLDAMNKAPNSMMIQALSGSIIDREYTNGSYLGAFPFSIAIRTPGTDTNFRILAVNEITSLYEWMKREQEAGRIPDIGNGYHAQYVEMTSTPSQAIAFADRSEDYQAMFNLRYFKENKRS